jgi:outer membrane protein assembly factor BamB
MRLARAVHRLDVAWGSGSAMPEVATRTRRRRALLKTVGVGSAVVALATGYLTASRPFSTLGWFTPGPQSSTTWSVSQYYLTDNPIAGDGLVFALATEDPNSENDSPGRIYAFNAATGQVEWTFSLTVPTGAPALVESSGVLYAVGVHQLYALSAATGRTLWVHGVKSNLESGLATSKAAIYFSDSGRIYALGASDGRTHWMAKVPRSAGDIPDVVAVGNFVSDLTSSDSGSTVVIYGFSELNGRILWSRNISSFNLPASPDNASTIICFTTHDDTLHAIDIESGIIIWNSPVRDVVTTPIVDGSTAYVGTAEGIIYALNIRTGEPRWSFTTARDENSERSIASIDVSGDTVFAESNSTEYALNAADGSLVWGYYFGGKYSPIGGTYPSIFVGMYPSVSDLGPPAVARDDVYLGMENSILVLRGRLC